MRAEITLHIDPASRIPWVLELHRPVRVYDECEHTLDHGCKRIEVYDYVGCDESFSGWACSKCCYDGEYPLECCDHGSANHSGIDFDHACRTRAILMGAEDND